MMPFDLRTAYTNAGFSRRGFARKVGVSEQSVRRLELGERIRPANAKKVADYFGLRVTDLMPEDLAA